MPCEQAPGRPLEVFLGVDEVRIALGDPQMGVVLEMLRPIAPHRREGGNADREIRQMVIETGERCQAPRQPGGK
jgi:hypothetical protein